MNDRLGEVEVDDDPLILSVTKHHGIVPADDYFNNRVASRDLQNYKVVAHGDFAYSTIHIDEGAIARNLRASGVVSPMYTVIRQSSEEFVPAYLEYVLQSRSLLDEYRARAAGSINRRRSLPFKKFAQIEIALPPLAEQHRVADLLAKVDEALYGERTRATRLRSMKAAFLSESLGALARNEYRQVGELANVRSGISWSKDDELAPGDRDGIAVMGVSNVQRDHVHADNCTWVRRTSQAEKRSIAEHTILMIRTNGNASRIGNVHLAPREAVGYTLSSFLTALTPIEPADAPYLLCVVQSPSVQQAITDATSGSTGLKNIAIRWIRTLEIPWPSAERRLQLAAAAGDFDRCSQAYAGKVEALQRLRRALIDSLLSGSSVIPESYDRFLSEEPAST